MSLYLLVTVIAISAQNGKVFWNLLEAQNQQNTVQRAKQAAATLSNLLDVWQSTVYATMHTIPTLDKAAFSQQVKALLRSNREFLAFSVIREEGNDKTKVFANALSQNTSDPRLESGQRPQDLKKLEEVIKQHATDRVGNSSSEPSTTMENLQDSTGLPLVQLQIPFLYDNSSKVYWAFLTVWADRIHNIIESKSDFEAVILDKEGRVFLSDPSTSQGVEERLHEKVLQNLNTSRQTMALHTSFDEEGIPTIHSASFVPASPFLLYVRKNAEKEISFMRWRTRQIALISWMFLLVTILASYYAAGRITQKINAVAEATQRISEGQWKTRIDTQSATRTDEVGALGRSVNHMAARIESLLDFEVEAARQEKELRTARAVQQTFFHEPNRTALGLSVHGRFEPASECAGDWWMSLPVAPDRHLVVIADATGHGASAALIVAMVYSFFHTTLRMSQHTQTPFPSPEELLTELNQILVESGKGRTTMTLFLAEFNTSASTLRYANAGHIAPLLIPQAKDDNRLKQRSNNPGKSRLNPLLGGGLMLGFELEANFNQREIEIREGDRLFLYTDGLIECTDEKGDSLNPMDLRRQIAAVAELQPKDLCDQALLLAHQRLGSAPREDDMTVVVVAITKEQPASIPPSAEVG